MAKTRHKAFSDFLKEQTTDEAFLIIFEAGRTKLRIARLIKAARLQRGWSQAELARRVGTTQSVIGRLESATDEREPSLSLLGRLASALGYRFSLNFVKPKEPIDQRTASHYPRERVTSGKT